MKIQSKFAAFLFIISIVGIGFSYYWYQMKNTDNSAFLTFAAIGIVALIQSVVIWKYSQFKKELLEYEYKHKDLHEALIKKPTLPHLSALPVAQPIKSLVFDRKDAERNNKENIGI